MYAMKIKIYIETSCKMVFTFTASETNKSLHPCTHTHTHTRILVRVCVCVEKEEIFEDWHLGQPFETSFNFVTNEGNKKTE